MVITSVSRDRARMQKMVILNPTHGKDSETAGHGGVVVVTLRCGQLALNCSFMAAYQLVTLCVCSVTKI